jgi:peptidyl-tRNA hydrolase, PTH1 family
MWIIAGLGNPGSRYAQTRHNVGFLTVDLLVARWGLAKAKKKFSALLFDGVIAGERVVLAQPQTFMNLSGDSIQPMAAFFKVPRERVITVHDELDLAFEVVKIKRSGGHAGHNGLRSLTQRLAGNDYPRVRIGVGRPEAGRDVADYVLSTFSPAERSSLTSVIERAADQVESILRHGVLEAMNTHNGAS